MVTPIFRWSGKYFGFISNNSLFAEDGAYVGWVEGENVWCENGAYLGEIVEGNYILKNENMLEPIPRTPRMPPITPIPPTPSIDRTGKLERFGWIDALHLL